MFLLKLIGEYCQYELMPVSRYTKEFYKHWFQNLNKADSSTFWYIFFGDYAK
jgi:hypothetical protein